MISLSYTVCNLFLLIIGTHYGFSLVVPQTPGCQDPLGMEDGRIKNDKIHSSESGTSRSREGYKGRLNNKNAYCTKDSPFKNEGFYDDVYLTIEISVDEYKITALALQGYGTLSYGKIMRLWYYQNDYNRIYKQNGKDTIALQGKKGNEIEYLVITPPIYTSKLKIQLAYTQNVHCLRLEIYGCKETSFNEYHECKSPNDTILQSNYRSMRLAETDAVVQDITFSANYLVFSKLKAWCLQLTTIGGAEYGDWATIDMVKSYLIYGIQVKGFMHTSDDDGNAFKAKKFVFQYSIDGIKKKYLESRKVLYTREYDNLSYFTVPLIARYIYISMKAVLGNLTCIKLELYGCKAKISDGTVTTRPSVTATNTTKLDPARISRYKIFEGIRYAPGLNWIDTKYDGDKFGKGEMNFGKGCLTDGSNSITTPFVQPKCWIGWNKTKVIHPLIYIVLIRPTVVSIVHLRTYVNKSMGALPINRITVETGTSTPVVPKGYLCSPDDFYNTEPRVKDYYIELGDTTLQYLSLKFEYSGSWILVRQIKLNPGTTKVTLPLSRSLIGCPIPVASSGRKEGTEHATIIVIIVLIMLLLLLLAFFIHHYRTNIRRAFKNRHGNHPIYANEPHLLNQQNNTNNFITSDPTKYQYDTVGTNDDEDIYAAVDATNSIDSGVLSDQHATYADCSEIHPIKFVPPSNTPNGAMLYSVPDTKQYADPNTLKRNSVIYQGSAIHDDIYENPYKATVASSLYAEPNKALPKSVYKIFPRNQLEFREKIGVGQFGEVHIAVATGLDDIYGSVGHYNSWGLPDTAMVAVKLLKSVDNEVEKEFMKEVDVMARLKDEHVVRLLGVCLEQPKLMVVEYMENGDLNQFLRERKPDMKNSRASQIAPDVLVLDHLLHMAQQIAGGMKYLQQEQFIHRDLATRNCLVGPAYQVKIADFGMSRYVYTKHYYRVEGKAVLPIRWMAPECLYYGKFTSETDVWSFGVTLWEIFSFAKCDPYTDLTDPQVIEAACDMLQNPNKQFPYLHQTENCPDDIYGIILNCWEKDPAKRPRFAYLYQELMEKCATSEGDI